MKRTSAPLPLIVGVAGLLLWLVLLFTGHAQHAWEGYLFSFVFWMQLPLGSLALLMIHSLTSGKWGDFIEGTLFRNIRGLLIMAVLFVPILFGMKDLFVWVGAAHGHGAEHGAEAAAGAVASAGHHDIGDKTLYLNVPFFVARALVFWAVWLFLGWKIVRNRREVRAQSGGASSSKSRYQAAFGMIALVLTMTFASFDWLMSREPHWYSTMFGVIVIAGSGLSALAFTLIRNRHMAPSAPLNHGQRIVYRDLGNLVFAFTLFWTYVSIMQFLIIWCGNLPEEVTYYIRRNESSWGGLSLLLVIGGFLLPFLALLFRRVKENPTTLLRVALFVLAVRTLESFWLVAPVSREGFHLGLSDIAAWVGIGGLLLAFTSRNQTQLALDKGGHA